MPIRKKSGIIVQARIGSTRLPGKMVLPIENKPALKHTIERLKKTTIENIIIATSVNAEDDAIADIANSEKILLYRGSQENVLDRYYQASIVYDIDQIIRICGDGVMMDPGIVDEIYRFYRENNFDYVSNNKPPSFQTGYEVEVFSSSALKEAWKDADKPQHLEHVTPYIWMNENKFKIGNYMFKEDVSRYQCALNNESDYKFIKAVFSELYSLNSFFTLDDVIDLLKRKPQIAKINQNSVEEFEQMMAEIKGGK